VVLDKIKELLQLNPKSKSIGADTLVLVFRISIADIMVKLLALEEEGHIKLYTETKNKTTKQVVRIELVHDKD
jgi:hypothetical protein